MKIELKCKKHPKGKAIQKPRVDCAACWKMWIVMHPGLVPQNYICERVAE